jgi:histidyl-tRNA synthetase
MEELGTLATASTPAPVLILLFDANHTGDYLRIARRLRAAGIDTEVFCDARNIGKQLSYASRKGFKAAVIAGQTEFEQGTWQVKDLQAGQQITVTESDLIDSLKRLIAAR